MLKIMYLLLVITSKYLFLFLFNKKKIDLHFSKIKKCVILCRLKRLNAPLKLRKGLLSIAFFPFYSDFLAKYTSFLVKFSFLNCIVQLSTFCIKANMSIRIYIKSILAIFVSIKLSCL